MGWAHHYIEQLKQGHTVKLQPRGNSMKPKISPGQTVTVEPVNPEVVESGDIVLCHVGRSEYLHIVKGIRGEGVKKNFLIGNMRGGINGWIPVHRLYGKVIAVE